MKYKHAIYKAGRYTLKDDTPTLNVGDDISEKINAEASDGWQVVSTSLSTPAKDTTFFLFVSVTYAKE
ncbi:MAG: hypothetical protein IPK99_13735 [Flavobacteriales bacterium]|nr:hypothetical protein [Flavobacteriales bacterium]